MRTPSSLIFFKIRMTCTSELAKIPSYSHTPSLTLSSRKAWSFQKSLAPLQRFVFQIGTISDIDHIPAAGFYETAGRQPSTLRVVSRHAADALSGKMPVDRHYQKTGFQILVQIAVGERDQTVHLILPYGQLFVR